MALTLHERGLFTWKEWAATLADEIKRAQAAGDPDTGATYYHHWLNALEHLVVAKGAATADVLHATAHAWEDAARATPHGQPITLERFSMTVRAGREFLAIPGPTTMPDEVLRAMHRPAVDIYSGRV